MSIVQSTQFTGTDQEAEAGEQQYHLCLTSESRLRATVSKASAWITGPCSRSRHTFSSFPYHHGVPVPCVRVVSYAVTRVCRTVATVCLSHREGRALPPRSRLTFFLFFFPFSFFFFSTTHDEFIIIRSGKFNAPPRLERMPGGGIPLPRRVHHERKGNGRPCNFLGSSSERRWNSGELPAGPVSSPRITVVLRFLSGI